MTETDPIKPRVFIDADVLFAGAAAPSEYGASLVILRMAEITLIEAVTSDQVINEAERNLAEKLPNTLPTFRMLVSRCLRVVSDPELLYLKPHVGIADPKDLPILIAAIREECPWLVTFNTRHFKPGHSDVTVLEPGDFVMSVRDLLTRLTPSKNFPF